MSDIKVLSEAVAEVLKRFRGDVTADLVALRDDLIERDRQIDELVKELNSTRDDLQLVGLSAKDSAAEMVKEIEERIDELDDSHSKRSGEVGQALESLQKLLIETEGIHQGILLREQLLDAKNWEQGIYREGDLVTHHIGQHFQATEDTNSEPGSDASWKRMGHSGLRYCGPIEADRKYAPGDIYVSDGSTFLVINEDEHRILSPRGQQGKRGLKGIPGEDGKHGLDGLDGIGIESVETTDTGLVLNLTDGKSQGLDLTQALLNAVKDVSGAIRTRAAKTATETVRKFFLGIFPDDGNVLPIQRFNGAWRDGRQYVMGDVVRADDGLFVARQPSEGIAPFGDFLNPTKGAPYWEYLAGGGGGGGGGGSSSGLPAVPTTLAGLAKRIVLNSTEDLTVLAHWEDDRHHLKVVQSLNDLNDRTVLPIGDLKDGTLVYVKDDNRIYEWLLTNNALRTDSISDWQAINAAGLITYNRVADLPQPGGAKAVHDGDMALVRYHNDGRTALNAVFVARKYGTATLPRPDPTAAIKDDGTVLTVTGLTPGNPASHTMYIQVDPAIDLAAGGWPLYIATDQKIFVQYSDGSIDEINIPADDYNDWNDLRTRGLNLTVGSVNPIGFLALDLSPDDSHTYLSVEAPAGGLNFIYRATQPVDRATNPARPTLPNTFLWMPVSNEIYAKPLKGAPDFNDAYDRDLEVTTEAGHKQIKIWDSANQQYITVYDEDTVKQWIAAGNLFTGTAEETGHGTAGAIDVANMPAQSALGPTDKGHYWVWVGTSGHAIGASEIGGAPSAIDGQALSVGDWIQVSEPTAGNYQYSVIPGDLLSKATAESLFGMNQWVAGAYQVGTLIVHQGDLYKASVAILATDPPPNDPANTKWTKVPLSGGVRSVATDGALPAAGAPPGVMYLVINSARGNNEPAMFTYDQPTGQWKQIGGAESHALDLSGGNRINNIGVPIGTVITYAGVAIPKGWLRCDGNTFDGRLYPQLQTTLGINRTPDLRGQFIRGATGNTLDNFAQHQHTTARPRTAFTTNGAGNHWHKNGKHEYQPQPELYEYGKTNIAGNGWVSNNERSHPRALAHTSSDGTHGHSIDGGGDPETAPDHVILFYLIKCEDQGMFGGA